MAECNAKEFCESRMEFWLFLLTLTADSSYQMTPKVVNLDSFRLYEYHIPVQDSKQHNYLDCFRLCDYHWSSPRRSWSRSNPWTHWYCKDPARHGRARLTAEPTWSNVRAAINEVCQRMAKVGLGRLTHA